MRQRRKETSQTRGLPVESLCLDMVRFVRYQGRIIEVHQWFPRPQMVRRRSHKPPRDAMLK